MNLIADLWRRWNLRGAYAGDVGAMNRLYFLNDPWGINSAAERFRFQETTRLIREKIAMHFRSILEVGCGEGLQTETLAPLCQQITGLDPSSKAIARARARGITNASFEVGDLTKWKRHSEARFELVTACEVLYYVQDLERAYHSLNDWGENCLVTYFQGAFDRLDPFFRGKEMETETIEGVNCSWRVVYWRPERG